MLTAEQAAGPPLLQVTDLKMYFPIKEGIILERRVGDVRAVDGVSFTIQRGETLGLVGESGSGKSTIGRAILRLYQPTAGSVVFDGAEVTTIKSEPLRQLRRRMQMIFQDPYASLNPRMTTGGIVGEPLRVHGIGTSAEREARVRELFATVGLDPAYGDRYPHEFSGGQRQRIGVARALAVHPELIVADEPVSALDVSIQAQIINLMQGLQERMAISYLFIAHDLSVVRHISHRVAVMYLGQFVEVARTQDLYLRPFHPYSVALLSAVPVPDPVIETRRKRIILQGDIPSPANPPSGCRFHTRCWLREKLGDTGICESVEPQLNEIEPGHYVACHFAEKIERIEEARTAARPRSGMEYVPGQAAALALEAAEGLDATGRPVLDAAGSGGSGLPAAPTSEGGSTTPGGAPTPAAVAEVENPMSADRPAASGPTPPAGSPRS